MKSMKLLPKKSSKDTTRQIERHLNVRLLPVLVFVLSIAYILTGLRGWLVFAIGTAGAWLTAWLWIYSMQRNLWIERKIHLAWATVGESVPEQVKLINHGWLPAIGVAITDKSAFL